MSGLSRERLDRMHNIMAGHVEGGSDPMRRDTIFRITSMTKPVAAVATMILVEDCKLRLDEPVDRLLPELADRRVLRRIGGDLDDTVPANRPITVRTQAAISPLFSPVYLDFRTSVHGSMDD